MRQDAGRARLAEQPLPQLRALLLIGDFAQPDRLDCDVPADGRVHREVDHTHSAAAQFLGDLIPADTIHGRRQARMPVLPSHRIREWRRAPVEAPLVAVHDQLNPNTLSGRMIPSDTPVITRPMHTIIAAENTGISRNAICFAVFWLSGSKLLA